MRLMADEAKIEFVGQDFCHDSLAERDVQRYFNRWILSPERGQDTGQGINADRKTGPKNQFSAMQAFQFLDSLLGCGDGNHDSLGRFKQNFARLRQSHLFPQPVEQGYAVILFHLLDVLTDARLRQVHGIRGAGKAARQGHSLEDS